MGSMSSYSSPKTSSYSSFSSSPKSSSYESSKVSVSAVTPKSSSYESSKVSASTVETKTNSSVSPIVSSVAETNKTTSKSSLNDFRDLLTSYLELEEKIEATNMTLERLNAEKRVLEEKIANDPKFETFSEMFNSIKGAKK
ncbi:MAG: hypothetical protein E7157_00740 [Lactobacillales bacterium]|nr:hypothetical protein [Lactobacillales bacterium]